MKRCTTCHRPLNRGSTSGPSAATRCLVCLVAEAMESFVYPPPKRQEAQAAARLGGKTR